MISPCSVYYLTLGSQLIFTCIGCEAFLRLRVNAFGQKVIDLTFDSKNRKNRKNQVDVE
jgi:hypothetical protein